MTRRRPDRFLALMCAAVTLAGSTALLSAASASAAIRKTATTHATGKFTKAADGTVTAEVDFTSSNPHCLEAGRWFKSNGNPRQSIGYELLFGGPTGSSPVGADGFGSPPSGYPIHPVSPPKRSPYVWQAVLPGDASVTARKGFSDPKFTTTVSQATGVGGFGFAPAQSNGKNYKAKYYRHGKKVKVVCSAGVKTGFNGKVFPF